MFQLFSAHSTDKTGQQVFTISWYYLNVLIQEFLQLFFKKIGTAQFSNRGRGEITADKPRQRIAEKVRESNSHHIAALGIARDVQRSGRGFKMHRNLVFLVCTIVCKVSRTWSFKQQDEMMAGDENNSMGTRPSLLNRLKSGDDTESWKEFYRIYGRLVRDFAIQAGLTASEAEEVVQETAIGASKHLPEYRYDPKVCRFKTWLLNQASWRIKDQLKKRRPAAGPAGEQGGKSNFPGATGEADTQRTATVNRLPDPAAADLDVLFEQEWRKNLFTAALDRVKGRFSLKQFQVFDLLVIQEWPASQVAKSLGVSLTSVYVTRHRISGAVKKEIVRLETKLEEVVRVPGDI